MTRQFPGMGMFFLAVAMNVGGQDPLRTLPGNYRVVFANQFVRVINVKYAAQEKLPSHNHPDKPTVYVYLTDSPAVRFSHIEEHAFSLVRPPVKAGAFRVSPGRLEKHEVENLGDIPTEFLRVELKRVPLGLSGGSFRDVKAFDLRTSGVSAEFSGPFITIQRMIAAGRDRTECVSADTPALLVAFSPTLVQREEFSPKPTLLRRGEVLWVTSHDVFRIASVDGKTAGHLLQISFQPGDR